jgi:hypothetical protein
VTERGDQSRPVERVPRGHELVDELILHVVGCHGERLMPLLQHVKLYMFEQSDWPPPQPEWGPASNAAIRVAGTPTAARVADSLSILGTGPGDEPDYP